MAPVKKIAKRQIALRDTLWPSLDEDLLWTRHMYNGFATIPKAMPLMLSIMDDLAGGQPVSGTYLELWCRTYDDCFAVLSRQEDIAFNSGFSGQRAVRTWKSRLKLLAELGFVKLASGPAGEYSYALILNPYLVIRDTYTAGKSGVRTDKYNALVARSLEIADTSLKPPSAKAP